MMNKNKGLPDDMLAWRHKQKRGAIMKPETFSNIEKKAEASGMSKEVATKIAGKAYWNTAKKKYSKSKAK
jgi:hypothetical protein